MVIKIIANINAITSSLFTNAKSANNTANKVINSTSTIEKEDF